MSPVGRRTQLRSRRVQGNPPTPTPLDIFGSDLLFWGRSTETITTASSFISQLTDLGPGGRHFTQPTASRRPPLVANGYQSYPVIRFRNNTSKDLRRDGTDFNLLPNPSGNTIYIIGVGPVTTSSFGTLYGKFGNYAQEEFNWLILDEELSENNGKPVFWTGNQNFQTYMVKANTDIHDGNIHCLTCDNFSSTQTIRVDTENVTDAADNFPNSSPSPVGIGAYIISPDSADGWTNFDLLEIIHTTRYATNADRAKVAAYVLKRYGLVIAAVRPFG